MQIESQNYFHSLNKKYQKIDSKGFFVCYEKTFKIYFSSCKTRLENLLSECQKECLPIHYAQCNTKKYQSSEFETITYNTFLIPVCNQQNIIKTGKLFISYRIIRLDKNKLKCIFPYLLLFNLTIQRFFCQECQRQCSIKLYQNQFQAIRSDFITLITNKITFMDRYPTYLFIPQSFQSKRERGFTQILRLRYQNFNLSQYYQASQKVSINIIRIGCIQRGFDYEVISLDNYCKRMKFDAKERQKFQTLFKTKEIKMKIKYICCRFHLKETWIIKGKVKFKYRVIELNDSFIQTDKMVIDKHPQFVQFAKKEQQNNQSLIKSLDIEKISNKFNFKPQSFDRQNNRANVFYITYSTQFNRFGSWHRLLSNYRHPFLVIISIQIPQQKCKECQEIKDGLIQMHKLIHQINKDKGIAKEITETINCMNTH